MQVFTHRYFEDPDFRQSYESLPLNAHDAWIAAIEPYLGFQLDEDGLAYDEGLSTMVSRLSDANVPIIAGTDAPIGFITPGAELHEELFLLNKAGLTPMQALRAATYEPAVFLGIEEDVGTISPGRRADLVLLSDNPLTDIRNTRSIVGVFKNGVFLDRKALDQLLEPPTDTTQ